MKKRPFSGSGPTMSPPYIICNPVPQWRVIGAFRALFLKQALPAAFLVFLTVL